MAIHAHKWTSSWQICSYSPYLQKRKSLIHVTIFTRSLHCLTSTKYKETLWTTCTEMIDFRYNTRELIQKQASKQQNSDTPGPGLKFLKASSALIRHSIEWPLSTISSCMQETETTDNEQMEYGSLPKTHNVIVHYLIVAKFFSLSNTDLFFY